MKRVAFYTTFFEARSGYSLVGVCETQIRSLLDHGYDPVVLVQDGVGTGDNHVPFEMIDPPSVWNDTAVDLRAVLPFYNLTDDIPADFEERVGAIQEALADSLGDVGVCITHDIILQKPFVAHNVAMRRYAETRPDLLWLHWIHSQPDERIAKGYPYNARYTPPPGYIVYPNHIRMPIVCRSYQLGQQEWRVKAHRHSIDPLTVRPYTGLTKALAASADFMNADLNAIYPVRLDRGKAPEKIIRLLAGVNRMGYKTRLLIADWQSAAPRFQTYIDELEKLADDLGVHIRFASRLHNDCKQGVPRQSVIELMDLSNVYFHPSQVETYSLTVHEAMLRGCLCVLNGDLDVLRELYGDNAIYMDFGADRKFSPDEQSFWNQEAGRLVAELNQNRALRARTKARLEWTPEAMWREFEPLLHLAPVAAI